MSTVASRYAKALLDLAITDGAVDEYRNEIAAVSKIYESENSLAVFLLSPKNDMSAKKKILTGVFGGSVRKNILNLLLLLLDKRRIETVADICLAYTEMADEYENVLNITIMTALPINKVQADAIGEILRAKLHRSSVKITMATDSSLIGGVKVAVGDRLYDGTVKGRLSKMQSALAGSNA